jgi:hypothetical protein
MSPSPTLSQVPILEPLNARLQAGTCLRSAVRARRSDERGTAARAKHGRIATAGERSSRDSTAHAPIYAVRVGPASQNSGGRPARVSAVGELHTLFLGLPCRF